MAASEKPRCFWCGKQERKIEKLTLVRVSESDADATVLCHSGACRDDLRAALTKAEERAKDEMQKS